MADGDKSSKSSAESETSPAAGPDAASSADSEETGVVVEPPDATDAQLAEGVETYDKTTADLAETRIIDPDQPDLNTASDHTSTAQGNRYPPGPDYFRAVARNARAEADAAHARAEELEAAAVEAEEALDALENEG